MLSEILIDELVATSQNAETWQEAVKICGDLLVNVNKISANFIASMIDVVYEFGPYMILVPEIAFFHGKPGPDVFEPCLSLITLAEPVYFKDFNNQKITAAFGFGAVDNESHMQMLMQVAQLLQDEKFVDLITHNGDKADIMAIIQKY